MASDEKLAELKRLEDMLWGGPDGSGLATLVQSNAKAIRENAEAIRGLRLLLHGSTDWKNGGLVDDVRENSRHRARVEKLAVWLAIAVGGSVIAQILRGIAWIVEQGPKIAGGG